MCIGLIRRSNRACRRACKRALPEGHAKGHCQKGIARLALTFQDASHSFPGVPQCAAATVYTRVAGVAGTLTTAGHALPPGGATTHGQRPRGYRAHHVGYVTVLRATTCKVPCIEVRHRDEDG